MIRLVHRFSIETLRFDTWSYRSDVQTQRHHDHIFEKFPTRPVPPLYRFQFSPQIPVAMLKRPISKDIDQFRFSALYP